MAETLASHVLVVVFAVALLMSITVIWNVQLIHNSRKRRRSTAFVVEHIKKQFVISDPDYLI